MFRAFVVMLLAVVIAGGVAYYNGWLVELGNEWGIDLPGPEPDEPVVPHRDPHSFDSVDLGGPLYASAQLAPLPPVPDKTPNLLAIEPCYAVVREKQEISSTRDGKILFIGHEITDKEPVMPDHIRPVKTVTIFDGKNLLTRRYRPLEVGDFVDYDQVIAVVDPSLAINDLAGKVSKVTAAKVDVEATDDIFKQTDIRLKKLRELDSMRPGSVTYEDMSNAEITRVKYYGDKRQKEQAVTLAESDRDQAQLVLSQHFLKNDLHGKSIIKKIEKFAGEGIKAQETILTLHNISRLRVEGSAGAQHFAQLRSGMACYLEPSVEESPPRELKKAHQGEVTSVAVCADEEHFISGSEDRNVAVWKRGRDLPVVGLRHRAAVRSVAASPKAMFVLAGGADGSVTGWDLTKPGQPRPVFMLADVHRGAVTALAFSPDGNYFATGGEDNVIQLFHKDGTLVYPFDVEHAGDDLHQGTITSLTFTPQCKLVSAARDQSLRVWSLHQKGARLQYEPLMNRGGAVTQLGVSANGRFLLFDQGKTLQLIDIEDGKTVVAVLDNLNSAAPFDTLALFSPDGSLMLTGGAGDGRLHLWKTPVPDDRAFQVREFVTRDRGTVTCAAFGPTGKRFAVSGSKDGYVHLWSLPDEETVKHHRIFVDANGETLRLDLVEQALDASKTRIAVNVANPSHHKVTPGQPEERLVPGQRMTLVVILDGAK
jgi:WD40 repeat protein